MGPARPDLGTASGKCGHSGGYLVEDSQECCRPPLRLIEFEEIARIFLELFLPACRAGRWRPTSQQDVLSRAFGKFAPGHGPVEEFMGRAMTIGQLRTGDPPTESLRDSGRHDAPGGGLEDDTSVDPRS